MISVCMVDASSMASCCSTGCTTQLTQWECLHVQASWDTQPSWAEPQYSDWLLLIAACKTMVADCTCSKCLWVHTLGHPRVDPVVIKDILLSCNCSTLHSHRSSLFLPRGGMRMLAVFVHGQTVCPPVCSPLAPTKDQIRLLWPCCLYVTETPST